MTARSNAAARAIDSRALDWRGLALCGLAVALCSCSDETTLTVTVWTDLVPGPDFDSLRLTTSEAGAETWSASYDIGRDYASPWSKRVGSPTGVARAAELEVTALLGGRSVLAGGREVDFVKGRDVEVSFCLWRLCIDDEDAPGCAAALCEHSGADGDGDADLDGDPDDVPRVDATADVVETGVPLCTDECLFAGNGSCDDGGDGSLRALCDFGADCSDCGTRNSLDCVPARCELRQCGSDGCGGSCGSGCGPAEECAPGGQCIDWIEVAAEGPFTVGSPEEEPGRRSDETEHAVELSRAFALTALEVSEAWYAEVAGVFAASYHPVPQETPAYPIAWSQAAVFCNDLSRAAGLERCYSCTDEARPTCELDASLESPYECDGYRIPTEAEWELAARAGTTTATYNGDLDSGHTLCEAPNEVLDPIAWFCGNTSRTMPRGELEPNALGLYDMLGNVNEWVHDRYAEYPSGPALDPFGPEGGTVGICRGGQYADYAYRARSAHRDQTTTTDGCGLRVARTIH